MFKKFSEAHKPSDFLNRSSHHISYNLSKEQVGRKTLREETYEKREGDEWLMETGWLMKQRFLKSNKEFIPRVETGNNKNKCQIVKTKKMRTKKQSRQKKCLFQQKHSLFKT